MKKLCILFIFMFLGCGDPCKGFLTSTNVCVLIPEDVEIPEELIENSIIFFAETLPKLTNRSLTPSDVYSAVSGTTITWFVEVYEINGCRNEGQQSGKNIWVWWNLKLIGSLLPNEILSRTVLFHEMLHLVDEVVFDIRDYRHEDLEWWLLQYVLNTLFILQ